MARTWSSLRATLGALDRRQRLAIAGAVVTLIVMAAVFVRPLFGPARAAVRYVTDLPRVEEHAQLLRRTGAEFGLDPNLLAALMLAESGGRVDAVSRADALGLFQLRLPTARDMAQRMGLDEPSRRELLRDAELNTRLGARYLVWLSEQFDGNLEQMLVAYNAGPGRLRAWIREAGSWEAWVAGRRAAESSSLLAYVDKVLYYRGVFRERGRVGG